MKTRYLNVAATIYIAFAIITAHSALAPAQATFASNTDRGSQVVLVDEAVRDHQRLDDSHKKARDPRADYTVEVWSSPWCSGCKTYKAEEVPTLLKLGYTVNIKDYQKGERPDEVTQLPTVALLYKGKPLKYVIYWKAADLDKFVKDNTKPVPKPPEIPDHIYSPEAA